MDWRQEILPGLRNNNPEAIREWVWYYAPKVQAIGLSYFHDQNEADALSKRVFSYALSSIQKGYTPEDMPGWLVELARIQASQAVLSQPARPLPPQSPAAPRFRQQPRSNDAPAFSPADIPAEAPALSYGAAPAASPAPASPAPASPAAPTETAFAALPQEAPPAPERPSRGAASPAADYADYYDDAWDPFAEEDEEEAYARPSALGRFFSVMLLILFSVLILVLLWALAGLLMETGTLPAVDLGYSWFNAHIYPFF